MRIFLLLDPPRATAQMQKIAVIHGKPKLYKPPNVLKARNTLISHLKPFKPSVPIEGPIELRVTWLFPRGNQHKHFEWKVTRPDTDNLQKMLKDCMTEVGFWKDDAQVVVEHVEKLWSNEPCGISITYENLTSKTKEVQAYDQ
jgi:Holliday junction resolvase RusA-like endonuclease